jgi:hypothetical protein
MRILKRCPSSQLLALLSASAHNPRMWHDFLIRLVNFFEENPTPAFHT